MRRVVLVLYFTFSIYLAGSIFFLYACSFAYPVVCRVFYSSSMLLTFSFPQLVPVFGNFLLYMFVISKGRELYIVKMTVTFAGVSADLLMAWYSSEVFARREMTGV